MKTFLKLVLIFGLLYCSTVFAQTTDIAGTWQGKLAIAKDQTINVHFIITKQADGSYKTVLNSPDFGGIKNVQANKVEFKDSKLTINVTSLSGSYSGMLAKGVFTGEWSQPGSKIPLALARYRAPTANALKPLLGSWVGKLLPKDAPSGITVVARFEMNKEGKFVGLLDVPDQGGKDLPITDIALTGSDVTFKIPVGKADYVGKLSGNTITGGIKQGPQETKLDFARGKYTPPPPDIKIAAEDMKQLLGHWSGKLKINETISLSLVIRFEQPAPGKYTIFMDSPDQKAKDIPITSASMADGKISLKVAVAKGEYSATLSGAKMDGTWTQEGLPNPIPLALVKE